MYSSIEVSASGLSAERLAMDVIANNLANVNTTRTPEGGAFKRQLVVFAQKQEQSTDASMDPLDESTDSDAAKSRDGVQAVGIISDPGPDRMVYDPTHPDAIKTGPQTGYVEMPNVNVVNEMVDMIDASRAYEANVTLINGSKAMFTKALEIGR